MFSKLKAELKVDLLLSFQSSLVADSLAVYAVQKEEKCRHSGDTSHSDWTVLTYECRTCPQTPGQEHPDLADERVTAILSPSHSLFLVTK